MSGSKVKNRKAAHNKKFDQIDLKIQKVVQKLVKKHPGNIQIKQITEEVGITRQGFYEHYKSVDEAILKGGDKLVREYCKFLNKRVADADFESKNHNQKVFMALFLYMSHFKDIYYQICVEPTNHHLIKTMMECTYPKLNITWLPANVPAPKLGDEQANVFIAIAVNIICAWGISEQCALGKSQEYIRQLIHLTNAASTKCRI